MEFAIKYNLGIIRAILLARWGQYSEAVKQYLHERQETEALDLALGHIDEVRLDALAFSAIEKMFLWRYLSFGCRKWPKNAEVPADKILALLGTIPHAELQNRDQEVVSRTQRFSVGQFTDWKVQISIFKHILQGAKSTIVQNVCSYHVLCRNSPHKAVKLLVLDYVFDDMSSALDVSSQEAIIFSLQLFYEYSLLIRDAALPQTTWKPLPISTLFQFEMDGKGVRTQPGTFLHKHTRTSEHSQSSERLELQTVSLPRDVFANKFSRLLSKRLESRIKDKDRVVSRLSLFDPCISHALHGTCRGDHPGPVCHQLDEDWFNRRVRIHLLQILILDNFYAFGFADSRTRIRSQR